MANLLFHFLLSLRIHIWTGTDPREVTGLDSNLVFHIATISISYHNKIIEWEGRQSVGLFCIEREAHSAYFLGGLRRKFEKFVLPRLNLETVLIEKL